MIKEKSIIRFVFSLIIFFIITFNQNFSFAQEQILKKSKWGLGFACNSVNAQHSPDLESILNSALGPQGSKINKSYSICIIPCHTISSDVLVRIELTATLFHYKYNSDVKNEYFHGIGKAEVIQGAYGLKPGVQRSILKGKRIELYFGLTFSYFHYNKIELSVYGESRNMPIDTITNWSKGKTTYPGGFSSGLGIFPGLSYKINHCISLSSEISYNLLYYKTGGVCSSSRTYQNKPNLPINESETTFTNSFVGFQFSGIIASLKISFNF